MSFLNIRGEQIHCENCGKTISVEYEGGAMPTHIGDMSVAEQTELSEQFMPDYDAENNGYYYQRFAVCSDCVKKYGDLKIFDDDHILFRYMDKNCELQDLKENLLSVVLKDFKKNLSEELLEKIDVDAYRELKNKKHFGIKKEKRRIAAEYISKAKRNIYTYVRQQLSAAPPLLELGDEIKGMEDAVRNLLYETRGSEIRGLIKLDMTEPRNLHPMFCYPASVRTPQRCDNDIDFFVPFECPKSEIKKTLNNKNKFKYNRNLPKDLLSEFLDRLPTHMAKIDF